MRHRNRGRKLGRNPKHQRALLRNLASALILTERDAEFDENAPKVRGRITTTLPKAKEVRPLVEKCVTIARKALPAQDAADDLASDADPNSSEWQSWRNSQQWQEWNAAIAPVVAARRRVLQLLGDKQAVSILFEDIAPRFEDREGGYTRIVRLPNPRLGDSGTQALLEFVGVRDRAAQKSQAPAFDQDEEGPEEDSPRAESPAATEEPGAEEEPAAESIEATAEQPGGQEGGEKSETEESPSADEEKKQ